ncbi:MAG: 16S rRNA (cytidine(1402)-2'-O)-methyltransferase [Flavobacteriaceae bacterium]|nr:MAG: 16S rRNA (cytidine(1402)-2'-O)-methyltransferase [Flavobacteriaceae bacterium]
MKGLYLVPTPIGNLEDITFRAVNVLKEADLILAEDTRTSGKLLKHLEVNTPMRSFHMHNEHNMLEGVLEELKSGKTIALISDAGTPGISDPGFLLVRQAIQYQIEVTCLPGATAFVPALVVSGIPCNEFVFMGFLPLKKGRKTKLESIKAIDKTVVLYESPHKIVKTLEELKVVLGPERKASLSREISKMYEETLRGTLEELASLAKDRNLKGEMVLVLDKLES